MSASSWEYNLESFGIACAVAAGITIPLNHHDESTDAATERLIFTATDGEQDPTGLPVYTAKLDVELRTTNRDATATDQLFAAIEEIFRYGMQFYPGTLLTARLLFPAGLWLELDASQNDRSDGANTRKRSRTYEFKAGH